MPAPSTATSGSVEIMPSLITACGAGSPCPSAALSVQASSSGHWENRSISIWDLPGSEAAATWAVSQTMFHWSFEQFAFYSVPAIVLGLLLYNFKKHVSYDPVADLAIGRHNRGLGNVFHFIIVFGMCAGVACSMGVGLMQIGSGIEYLSGLTSGKGLWLILAAIVTFMRQEDFCLTMPTMNCRKRWA